MIRRVVGFLVPSCDPSASIGRIRPFLRAWGPLVAAGIALAVLPSCADDGEELCVEPPCDTDEPDAGARPDGGLMATEDAGPGLADAGPSPHADAGSGVTGDARFGAGACFNGADDDGEGLTDCEDPSCGEAAYCCAGETSAGCCVGPGRSVSHDFTACEAEFAVDCGGALEAFGSPPPVIEDEAFLPNGDAFADAGLVLGDTVDPTRERVTLTGRIAAPREGCGAEGCTDAVLLGIGAPPADGATEAVPDVAVMVRASRSDYALVIAGEVVAEWALADSEAHDYGLRLAPDGAVTLTVDDGTPVEASFLPRPGRHVLLYGRSHNREDGLPPTRALSVSVATAGCDVPGAMAHDAAPVAPWDPAWDGRTASAPSAVRTTEGDVLVAVELADGVALLHGDGSDWTIQRSLAMPPLEPPVNERYLDPELVVGDDRYEIYLTHETPDGRSLAVARGEDGFALSFDAPEPLTLPDDAPALSSPAVASFGGSFLLAAVVEGEPRVVMLRATDAAHRVFAWAGDGLEDATVVTPGEAFAFDGDEVGDPALFDDGVLLRLLYAGRRGTRWAIGERVSGNAVTWRAPHEAPILRSSGAAHDALGVRDPSALARADGSLWIFHTTTDGARPSVGLARGSVPR